jgi:hypothetical protein
MNADVPPPAGRVEALEVAGDAVRDARSTDRDAILAAQRVLRQAEQAHDRAVRLAEERARADAPDADAAQRALEAAHAERDGVAEARPLLDRVVGRLAEGEEVLDMVAGISAGHDGVLVATTRRILFVAPRRTIDLRYEDVESVRIRGRRFGARATLVARGDKHVVSGLSPVRAEELGSVLAERVPARG